MENIRDTTYDFVLVLRQMYVEAILREKLEAIGADYYSGAQCIEFNVDEDAPQDTHCVTSTFIEKKSGEPFHLNR